MTTWAQVQFSFTTGKAGASPLPHLSVCGEKRSSPHEQVTLDLSNFWVWVPVHYDCHIPDPDRLGLAGVRGLN